MQAAAQIDTALSNLLFPWCMIIVKVDSVGSRRDSCSAFLGISGLPYSFCTYVFGFSPSTSLSTFGLIWMSPDSKEGKNDVSPGAAICRKLESITYMHRASSLASTRLLQ